ncbi:MAG: hypothetical protein WCS65_12560 [Verrucomicrobiae bacterium]
MSIDILIQQLERLKMTGIRTVDFVWDDGFDRDSGCWLSAVCDEKGKQTENAEIVLGCWGERMREKHGAEPRRPC